MNGSSPDDVLARILNVAASSKRTRSNVSVVRPSGELPPGATERPMRVAAYCRYSSHLQDDGYSIQDQHTKIDEESLAQARRGITWQLTYWDEPARSAKAEKLHLRTQFLSMLHAALSGEYDIIVVYKLNRFSRNELVSTLVFNELEKAGVGFLSLSERFDVTTPAGWVALRLHMALAESDNRERARAIAGGKDARAEDGLYGCRVPFGYRKNAEHVRHALDMLAQDARHGAKLLGKAPAVPDEGGDWQGLQAIGAMMLQGMTDQEIAEHLHAEGRWHLRAPGGGMKTGEERPWTRQAVAKLRRNRFYRPFRPGETHGTIVHNGQDFRGAHVAAFTWEQWRTMQQVAQGRRRGWKADSGTHRKEPYTAEFRGIAACGECGGRLYVWRTVHDHDKRTGAPFAEPIIYERYVCLASERNEECSQDHRWARVEDVRAAWVDWLTAHLLPQEWQEVVRERVMQFAQQGEPTPQHDALRELRRWEEKRRRAVIQFREVEIEELEYRAVLAQCDAEIERLSGETAGARPHITRLVDAGNLLTRTSELWSVMTTDQRSQAAALMIERHGLRLRLIGQQGFYNRWQKVHEREPSCEITEIRLRPPFPELLSAVAGDSTSGSATG